MVVVFVFSPNLLRVARAAGTVTDCSTFGPGVGTLLEALSGGGLITFECSGTVVVPNFRIAVDTVIDGSGQIVVLSGNNTSRVLRVDGGTVELRNITVANGKGPSCDPDVPFCFGGDGGGIFNNGDLILKNTTITNSSAGDGTSGGGNGGGIANQFGTVTLINSTISGNSTGRIIGQLPTILSGRGGGISNWAGEVMLFNSTITNNSASTGNGGGIENSAGSVSLVNSILADQLSGEDCLGQLVSAGHNLDSDGTCNLTQPNDLPNTDPVLGPLADNGGPTETHALLRGSPAIDAGEVVCTDPDGAPLTTDQRGEPRPVDGNGDSITACDIGAFEAQFGLQTVDIDIKPFSKPNVINPRSKGGVWVAILSDTGPDSPFDPPSQVDIPTVEFGPDGAEAIRHKVKDINKDGLGDLLLLFKIRDTGIACGDTEATLTGRTFDGVSFTGTDSIKTVGCKPNMCHKKKHHKKHHHEKHHGKYLDDDCGDDEKHPSKHKEKERHDEGHDNDRKKR